MQTQTHCRANWETWESLGSVSAPPRTLVCHQHLLFGEARLRNVKVGTIGELKKKEKKKKGNRYLADITDVAEVHYCHKQSSASRDKV